jgi:hypothetical protein
MLLFLVSAGIFRQSMGARKQVGIGLLYQPARLHRLAEPIPWNRFLGSIKVRKNTSSGKIIRNQKTSAKRNKIFYLPPMANGVNFRRRVDHFLPSQPLHRPEKNINPPQSLPFLPAGSRILSSVQPRNRFWWLCSSFPLRTTWQSDAASGIQCFDWLKEKCCQLSSTFSGRNREKFGR